MNEIQVLIIDGYPEPARQKFHVVGMSLASELYRDMLLRWEPGARYDIFYPADPGSELPRPLKDYDAVLWTGTNVTIYHLDDPAVVRMIELGKEIYEVGVPSFGSCWGLQMAAVAAGGKVTLNPKGREMGIGRKIALTDAGLRHPFMAGKPRVFDVFISHYDEVTTVPDGGVVLAGNGHTGVQALAVQHANGTFWAVQYHPEYTMGEMARLMVAREARLLNEGFFATKPEFDEMVARMEALAQGPGRKDLRWQLAIDDDVLDADVRQVEFGNFLSHLVRPHAAQRQR